MGKTKILHVTNDLEIGGVQRVLIDIVSGLDKEQYDLTVVLVCAEGEMTAYLDEINIPWKFFPCIRRNRFFKWVDFRQIIKLARWMKNRKFTVVQTHLFLGNFIGRLAAKLAGVPFILATEHNTYLFKTKLEQKLDRLLSTWTLKIIAVTQAVADFTSQQESIPPEKFKVIHNGIDLTRFTRDIDESRQNHPENYSVEHGFRIGCVGRLVPQKDFPLLIQSFNLFRTDFPDSSLTIVGDGPQRKELEKLVQYLDLNRSVRFEGFQDDVARFFYDMDVFLLTPRYEGLGLVILEAMAMGVPVIATAVGGIPEIVQHKQTGLLADERSPEKIAELLTIIATDRELRHDIIEKSLSHVQNNFSREKMCHHYEKFYRDIMGENI